MKYIYIIIIVTVLFLTAFSTAAFEGCLKAEPLDLAGEIKSIEANCGSLVICQGEIMDVAKGYLDLRTHERTIRITLTVKVRIFLNGRLGEWFCLRPVTRGFYIIARIWMDRDGNARLIEGRYEGESVRILAAAKLNDGRYCLAVKPLEPENAAFEAIETAVGCRGLPSPIPEEFACEAFILLDFDGRVRGVFLL